MMMLVLQKIMRKLFFSTRDLFFSYKKKKKWSKAVLCAGVLWGPISLKYINKTN